MSDIVAEAEFIIRGALEAEAEPLLDELDMRMRLGAERLTQAAHAAQDAMMRLHKAVEGWSALQANACAQVAAMGLDPDGHLAGGRFQTGTADGVLVLRGQPYAPIDAADILARTISYAINESAPRPPAGSRIVMRVQADDVENG